MAWVIALAVLLAGCVHVAQEPPLPMPVRPQVTFFRCVPSMICMTELDANKLLRYTEQLDAFEKARAELIR